LECISKIAPKIILQKFPDCFDDFTCWENYLGLHLTGFLKVIGFIVYVQSNLIHSLPFGHDHIFSDG
jgi:hypothetical protein